MLERFSLVCGNLHFCVKLIVKVLQPGRAAALHELLADRDGGDGLLHRALSGVRPPPARHRPHRPGRRHRQARPARSPSQAAPRQQEDGQLQPGGRQRGRQPRQLLSPGPSSYRCNATKH